MKTKTTKIPTIQDLITSMPPTGLDSVDDRFLCYATLSFYWDGVERKTLSIRKLKQAIGQMDEQATESTKDWVITELEDDDADSVGLQIIRPEADPITVWIKSPSIQTMPKLGGGDQAQIYRSTIALADEPNSILDLPYILFPHVGILVGKSLGIL